MNLQVVGTWESPQVVEIGVMPQVVGKGETLLVGGTRVILQMVGIDEMPQVVET